MALNFNIAEGFLGDYSSAYINGKLNQGGRQLLSESGPNILDGLFKREADDFGKYEQAKPWEIFDKNHLKNRDETVLKDWNEKINQEYLHIFLFIFNDALGIHNFCCQDFFLNTVCHF